MARPAPFIIENIQIEPGYGHVPNLVNFDAPFIRGLRKNHALGLLQCNEIFVFFQYLNESKTLARAVVHFETEKRFEEGHFSVLYVGQDKPYFLSTRGTNYAVQISQLVAA